MCWICWHSSRPAATAIIRRFAGRSKVDPFSARKVSCERLPETRPGSVAEVARLPRAADRKSGDFRYITKASFWPMAVPVRGYNRLNEDNQPQPAADYA